MEIKTFKTRQLNKYGHEKQMCYFEYKGVKCVPMQTLTFFTLDVEEKDHKAYSKRNDRVRDSVKSLINTEESPYTKSLLLDKDYFVITKEENPNEWNTMINSINEDYFENTGKKFNKGNSAKTIYLFTESGCNVMFSNFKFGKGYKNEKYSDKHPKLMKDRAVYFTQVENFINKVFDLEIKAHTWLYINRKQIDKYMEMRKDILETLKSFHNDEYQKNEQYKYSFGMTKSTEGIREAELEKVIKYHLDTTFGHEEKLSYRCVKYVDFLALKDVHKEITEKSIDLGSYIIDLINIYKPVKSIVNHGGHKLLEQYLVNKNESVLNIKGCSNLAKLNSEYHNEFNSHTLRYKVMNFIDFTGNILKEEMKDIIDFDIEYFNEVYENSLIITYLKKLRQYQITLKEYHSVNYDINYNVDKFKQPIGMIYDKFIRNEIVYGMNYRSNYGYYFTSPPYYGYIDEYDDSKESIIKQSKEELLELREKVITLKNDLYQLGTYLKEYLKDEISVKLCIKDEDKKFDLSSFIDGSLNNSFDVSIYENEAEIIENKSTYVKKTHINKLLEDY